MPPETGPARRRGDDAFGVVKDVEQAFVACLFPDGGSCRNHHGPGFHLAPFEDCRGNAQILDAPVSAGADVRLVYTDIRAHVANVMSVRRQVRKRHHRFHGRHINGVVGNVLRVRVRMIHLVFRPVVPPLTDVRLRDVVRRNDARFRPRLDRHVGDGHSGFHAQVGKRAAVVFHRHVTRAIHPDAADDFENDVLRIHALRRRAVQCELHGFRHAKPELPRIQRSCEIGAADSGGKRPECTVRAGVRITPYDDFPGQNVSLFRKNRVANPVATEGIVVPDVVPFHPPVQTPV
ncbi:MAG: hypothetical protein BWY06_03250 [Candidatus Latescibacteria bacterium ADurb.Bin168]|nr:MAG: hypothetical protein BWY06_03250 [Candidatus Latescibacteria bacterium ADurb.Bin168]